MSALVYIYSKPDRLAGYDSGTKGLVPDSFYSKGSFLGSFKAEIFRYNSNPFQ
jgi:hypothetical protein